MTTRPNNIYICRECIPSRPFKTCKGLAEHFKNQHQDPSDGENESDVDRVRFAYRTHPKLTASPCDRDGNFLDPTAPPSLPDSTEPPAHSSRTWHPFQDRIEFEFAHLHFVEAQSPNGIINRALDLWAANAIKSKGMTPPWKSAKELYAAIDNIREGKVMWKVFTVKYNGPLPRGIPPKWMTDKYHICTRDAKEVIDTQLKSEHFKDQFNYRPYKQFENGKRRFSNLMSGTWVWNQADIISEDPQTHGAMLVPIVLGSDKTTVSVATGHQEYHSGYISPGNLTNQARCAHKNGILLYVFLPIPKANRQERRRIEYQRFVCQLYHESLTLSLNPLKPGMTTPEIVQCPDRHYRRAIYELGPYIADYPEQVLLAGIVQNWCPKCFAKSKDLDNNDTDAHLCTRIITESMIRIWDPGILWDEYGIREDFVPFTYNFPRADIHQLISPDLLHQIIKGTFKDHLVTWVNEFILLRHGTRKGEKIIDDIDRRLAAVPSFPGIRRFPTGRDFKQWTGNDSKALMKIYIPAIQGYVTKDITRSLRTFMNFTFLVQQNSLLADEVDEIHQKWIIFKDYRQEFIKTGVRESISLPRQHSMGHFADGIRKFGAPCGLDSSIMESKHIEACKKPWQQSSRVDPLPQMLVNISRMERLKALYLKLDRCHMLDGSVADYTLRLQQGALETSVFDDRDIEVEGDSEDDEEKNDMGPSVGPKVLSSIKLAKTRIYGYPTQAHQLQAVMNNIYPTFLVCIQRFIHDHIHSSIVPASTLPDDGLPAFSGRVHIFHSAVARFYAPSDLCGAGGMYRERIHSNPSWNNGRGHFDTILVEVGETDEAEVPTMKGMVPARVLRFLSMEYEARTYQCAFIHWFTPITSAPDEVTGMWVVRREMVNGMPLLAVIPLDVVVRGVHLIPEYGNAVIPEDFDHNASLDAFESYYVNRYSDHHMFDLLK
ncbi:hypothetical protein D9757_009548 [Collybiopsis confluens]|uniref:C2H2-type domain-containing protein n=1 Tax=Collybiopsis confluens TaxID=2823264 RepID=A0A8H5H923_9AGAR|nr:hypothetical protein D9757_009548 [Collybiopsis confluens]